MWLFELFFLNSANLICRGMDISKYFRGSLGIRDNESRLYLERDVPINNTKRTCSENLLPNLFVVTVIFKSLLAKPRSSYTTTHWSKRVCRNSKISDIHIMLVYANLCSCFDCYEPSCSMSLRQHTYLKSYLAIALHKPVFSPEKWHLSSLLQTYKYTNTRTHAHTHKRTHWEVLLITIHITFSWWFNKNTYLYTPFI